MLCAHVRELIFPAQKMYSSFESFKHYTLTCTIHNTQRSWKEKRNNQAQQVHLLDLILRKRNRSSLTLLNMYDR
jgi:hypothetical protein